MYKVGKNKYKATKNAPVMRKAAAEKMFRAYKAAKAKRKKYGK
jgi:hypothetical protein